MFGKSIEEVMKENGCSRCLHKNVCNQLIQLEIEGGKCKHYTSINKVFVDQKGYCLEFKLGDKCFVINQDRSSKWVEENKVHEILINGLGVMYHIPFSKRAFVFGENIFKTEEEAQAKFEEIMRG